MKLTDFLLSNHVPLDVKNYKLHLASLAPGGDSPLLAFFDGGFKDWQEWQTRRNFECQHIVSLIQLPERNRWLFAGVYQVDGVRKKDHLWKYATSLVPGHEEWIGRVVVEHARSGRAAYLWGSAEGGPFTVCAIREQRMSIEEFPGYNWTRVAYAKLKTIVFQEVPSWKAALSNVKGIYLITDTLNGKHYVGKADGESGLWQRWCAYVGSGHGGNKELREILGTSPLEYRSNFQFSILEIADTHASDEYIGQRESHWKEVLKSRRPFGYNAN